VIYLYAKNFTRISKKITAMLETTSIRRVLLAVLDTLGYVCILIIAVS
jgi:hypothetical protein